MRATRFPGVLLGMRFVAARDLRVMAGLFAIAGTVVFGSRLVMVRGLLVMIGCFRMMLGCFGRCHAWVSLS